MKAVQHDMTSGSPMRIILNFTLPIFIGNVFQQFYNMADAVIVGELEDLPESLSQSCFSRAELCLS